MRKNDRFGKLCLLKRGMPCQKPLRGYAVLQKWATCLACANTCALESRNQYQSHRKLSYTPGHVSQSDCMCVRLSRGGKGREREREREREIIYNVYIVTGDLLNNYCSYDPVANVTRLLFACVIMLTYPIECFVAREVCVYRDTVHTCMKKNVADCMFRYWRSLFIRYRTKLLDGSLYLI